ncbi:hypothetical protein IJG12_00960 [Candidatus Saccharibacteria bacterium]|nr:hypothetical protein [Candidatus Saccharibacteria bacterium]
MSRIIKFVGFVFAVLFSERMFFWAYNGTLMGLNYWTKIGALGLVAVIIAGIFQYDETGRRRYNERMFLCISVVFSAVVAAALFIEGCDTIIALLDTCLTSSDSPLWSVILAPWVAMFAGAAYCFVLAYTGAIIGELRRLRIVRHF